MLEKKEKKKKRHRRLRAKIFGTKKRPRLCVFRSARHIYAQLIDDEQGRTILSASDTDLKKRGKTKKDSGSSLTGKVKQSFEVGRLLAEKALAKKIKEVVFDRAGYKYHGRVKALAEGAREGGLKF